MRGGGKGKTVSLKGTRIQAVTKLVQPQIPLLIIMSTVGKIVEKSIYLLLLCNPLLILLKLGRIAEAIR
jgi:hypothetical protein